MSTLEDSDRIVGDYRWLWEITYACRQRVVQSVYGTGEVETVGFNPYVAKFHVIAATEALARIAWWTRFAYDETNKLQTCEKILLVDAEVNISGSRCSV